MTAVLIYDENSYLKMCLNANFFVEINDTNTSKAFLCHSPAAELQFDLSVIPSEMTNIEERRKPGEVGGASGSLGLALPEQPSRAAALKAGNLSTIIEESGSYRSSGSSSRSSAGSTSGASQVSTASAHDYLGQRWVWPNL